MKGYLKYALVIILMIALADINAQIKSRYSGGVHLSTMAMNIDGLSSDPTMPLGIHFGRIFEIPIIGGFNLQTGIFFSAKGTDYEVDSVRISLSPIYFEIPVNAVYTFGSDKVKISLFAGPYFACGVGGTLLEAGQPLKDLKFGTGESRDLKFFDIGLNFGLGICIKKFLVTAQYQLGLSNASPNTNDGSEIKNNVIGISVTTPFIGKK